MKDIHFFEYSEKIALRAPTYQNMSVVSSAEMF